MIQFEIWSIDRDTGRPKEGKEFWNPKEALDFLCYFKKYHKRIVIYKNDKKYLTEEDLKKETEK